MITFIPKRGNAELRAAILDCIRNGLTLTAQISARLNVDPEKISTRLDYLRTLGMIHAVRIPSAKGGFVNEWRLGPALDEYGQPGHVHQSGGRSKNDGQPHVIISTTYPTVGRRDSLVAALHGAPKQSAPVCTTCRMEQGAGHVAGCRTAMVSA